MKSILPIIFIILALTGAIAYSLAKRAIPQKPIDNVGISANQLKNENSLTPTPTGTIKATVSVTPTVTIPVVTEKAVTPAPRSSKSEVRKTTICTPVYGAADTCTEHVVVDTGIETAMFFNLAGLAYLGGLASFIKAKSLKK
jgi:hypothetical protein